MAPTVVYLRDEASRFIVHDDFRLGLHNKRSAGELAATTVPYEAVLPRVAPLI